MSPNSIAYLSPKFVFRFKGESGAGLINSAPVPAPSPPVTMDSSEVVQAEQETAQQNLMKKSFKQTIQAGDTGGYMASAAQPAPVPGVTPGATYMKGK